MPSLGASTWLASWGRGVSSEADSSNEWPDWPLQVPQLPDRSSLSESSTAAGLFRSQGWARELWGAESEEGEGMRTCAMLCSEGEEWGSVALQGRRWEKGINTVTRAWMRES